MRSTDVERNLERNQTIPQIKSLAVTLLLITFGLIGCSGNVADTLDSAAQPLKVEPEATHWVQDPEAEGGEAAILYSENERATFTLGVPSGTYEVSVHAKAQEYEGWPALRLSRNGQPIGEPNSVKQSHFDGSMQRFGPAELERGDRIEAIFIGDRYGGSSEQDRNVMIDYLELTPEGAPSDDATPPEDTDTDTPTQPEPSGKTRSSCDTEHLYTGERFSPAWTSGDFQGTFCREVTGDGEYLSLTLEVQQGGFDTGIAAQYEPTRVDDLSAPLPVSTTVTPQFSGPGTWWVGPKVLVLENTYYDGLDGEYENYVVENASQPPEHYHAWLGGDGKYLGETYQDGGVYKHYLVTYSSWEQFWAVRQDYRQSGAVDMAQILGMWRQHGLPNEYVGGVKANVETSKEIEGTLTMDSLSFPASITDR